MVINVKQPNELNALNQLVHDLWLDIDLLKTTDCPDPLIIELFVDGKLQDRVGSLTIGNLQTIHVEDSENIGGYDIDRIDYSPKDGRLEFKMNIPCQISIGVERLSLQLDLQK